MSGGYHKPSAAGVRLHLNENTDGCSPAVLTALRALGRADAGCYPEYEAARQAVARHLDVPVDHVLLTNGLDEGILAAAAAALRQRDGAIPEGIGVAPAFDMYSIAMEALGGRMITVPVESGFRLPVDPMRAAITPYTRIIFLANPHNPSGVAVPLDELRDLARLVAPITLFVDEAYADFSGASLIDRAAFEQLPNLVVGRTFSKAYGLAGLRAGALVAAPETLAPMRRIVPPYSMNAWAAAALPVALTDRPYRDWYLSQVAESRTRLAAACARLGLHTWPSAANFMLVRVGPHAPSIASALAARGIAVRDRSGEVACNGCLRITTGNVRDTERLIAALEEVLCDAQQ